MNYRMVKYTLAWVLLFEAGFFIVPMITAIAYREREFFSFLLSAAICAGVAGLMLIRKPKSRVLYAKEGILIVSLCWVLLSTFGALPFMFSGLTDSYVDAVFETVSGFTTTGSSIFTEVESLPYSINMWRCFTHWVGGMGVLVFIMAFLPLSGAQNMHIMKAESPGPSVSKLVPRVKTTALILYLIYFVLTIVQIIFLLAGGMPLFDTLCTAFATAGTGGFGIKNDSFGSYSPYLQIVVTVFLLLFSLNFGAYYLLLKGKIKDAFTAEIRAFLLVVAVAISIITFNIHGMFDSVGTELRHSAFTVASIISTAGFASTDFNLWPTLSHVVIVLLMFIGACAGSTGGGIKISRLMIFFKNMINDARRVLHPRRIQQITVDSRPIEADVVRSVCSYMALYVLIFVSSIVLISFDGYDLTTTFTAVATAQNNVGPGLGLVGPSSNFSFLSPLSKLVLSFDMLAGRLELFPMILLFSPSTWRSK